MPWPYLFRFASLNLVAELTSAGPVSPEHFGTVAIVGVGLIGGSIGLTLRKRSLAGRVIGIGRSQSNLDDAIAIGAISEAAQSLEDGVADADIVVVCTPVTQIVAHVHAIVKAAPRVKLVTDAGSTKRTIVEGVETNSDAQAVFVGGHPIAGSERKGAGSAIEGLFDKRVCVLTPTSSTPFVAIGLAKRFWEKIGCRIVELSPERHDDVLAMTSHLPHAVAAALAGTVAVDDLVLAAGAYRDVTRVSLSDAKLWAGIFLANRRPLLRAIDAFEQQLAVLRELLETNNDDSIENWWNEGRRRRILLKDPLEGFGG